MKSLHKALLMSALLSLGTTAALHAESNQETVDGVSAAQVAETPAKTTPKPNNQRYIDRFIGGETTVLVIGDGQNEMVKVTAIEYFQRTLRRAPWQVGMPRFIITDKANRAAFAIGGFVNFRTAYDFNNVVNNRDFVTYDIPMQSMPATSQQLLMDASTSRLYFKSVIDGGRVGPIEAYIETDFRGNGNSLRLREAYVKVGGFLFGQSVTTFCDLEAGLNTIDFQGPNAYTYNRNLMLRYSKEFNNHWSLGVAIEYPELNGSSRYQRVPDIPAYVQFAWDKKQSHIRLSAVGRTFTYDTYDQNTLEHGVATKMGYGVALSGVWQSCPFAQFKGQVLYGEGISAYVQDIQGTSLDLVSDPQDPNRMIAPPVMSWYLGTQLNLTKNLAMNLGYSQVRVFDRDGSLSTQTYKLSQYVVGNLIYSFSPAIQAGVEYLYGTRINQDDAFGKANRVQAMVQVNF